MTEGQTSEHRRDDLKVQGFGDPLYIETGPEALEKGSLLTDVRELFSSLFARKKKPEIFDASGHAKWNEVFKLINPNSNAKRFDNLKNIPIGMSEDTIATFIYVNYPTFVQDGFDPLEFPECADRELRPIFNAIGHTTWGHPYDGAVGRRVGKKDIVYDQPFLRVLLDLNKPSASKYIAEAEKLKAEWMQKYPNLKISLNTEKKVGKMKSPRIIAYGIELNIDPPAGTNKEIYIKSEECHNISSSFFAELDNRIAAMQN